MIDMHTHILPGLDTGCKDYQDAEKMIDEEIALGIKQIVLTPHLKSDSVIDRKSIIKRYSTFIKWFEKKHVTFSLGAEIEYSNGLLELIKNRELLTMNGTNVAMIDFLDGNIEEIIDTINEFKREDYKIIVAHIEYYHNLTVKDIIKIKEKGALIQVNAETIVDKKNDKWVKTMLKERIFDFVASNGHSSKEKNYMLEAYDFVEKKTSEDYAELVFKRNQKNFLLL